MGLRLSQSDLSEVLDVSQPTLSEATSEGYKCRGYPVGAWAIFDGAGRVTGYDVPQSVVERSNPPVETPDLVDPVDGGAATPVGGVSADRTMADAFAETGGPVSANAGAAAVGMKAMDTVEEQPEVMEDVVDALVMLGTGGIVAFATDADTSYRAAKVAGSMISVFVMFKGMRAGPAGDSSSLGELPESKETNDTRERSPEPKARGDGRARGEPIVSRGAY
jgi:hypothetical protein